MAKLFDESSGLLLLDEMVFNTASYQAIIEDKVITDQEIMQQASRVEGLLKKAERQLNDADRELVFSAISELAVLYQLHANKGGN